MQNLLDDLKKLLKKDNRLTDEDGELLKNKITELALKMDTELLELVASSTKLKEHFFVLVGKMTVFDKEKFIKFVGNKDFLPDSYTAFKNKIGLTVDDEYITEKKDVVLSWPYKDCVLEGGQTKEDAKRNEIFWNETLAPDEVNRLLEPKVFTNWNLIDKDGEHDLSSAAKKDKSLDWDKQNYIIKGNNLLALHSLKKRFAGQVKLIYIDPPYNTGNDSFGYNDRFNHSTWLTFMRNRLEAAHELLGNDGSIWINIDDTEAHYLKVLCDEVFNRENFVANVVWEKKYSAQSDTRWLSDNHDHLLVFAKDKNKWRPNLLPRTEASDAVYRNPDNDSRGPWMSDNPSVKTYSAKTDFAITTPFGRVVNPPRSRCWRFTKEQYKELLKDNRIWFGKSGDGFPRVKTFLSDVQEGLVAKTLWLRKDVGDNQESKREVNTLLKKELFSTPKPERLIQRILQIGTNKRDLVFDFFAGSATSGAVAMKMNRRFILCEQMDYAKKVTVERVKKVIKGEQGGISKEVGWKGGRSFVYTELEGWNERYVQRIKEAKTKPQLQKLWKEMQERAHLSYRFDDKEFKKSEKEFNALSVADQKKFLLEVLDKNQLYVNFSEIEDEEYGVGEVDKKLNREFYGD